MQISAVITRFTPRQPGSILVPGCIKDRQIGFLRVLEFPPTLNDNIHTFQDLLTGFCEIVICKLPPLWIFYSQNHQKIVNAALLSLTQG